MDRTTRWETEALRDSGRPRPSSPRPTKTPKRTATNWVTLREAEAATGIPVNTLRKWARKSAIPSYLESDGDLALRMVDLDAVEGRARALGRETPDTERLTPEKTSPATAGSPAHSSAPSSAAWEPSSDEDPVHPASTDADEPATMMVPVDAWNKMLSQLGNLHEAGQQLSEARERAAKAETEAEFLRLRLAELRDETGPEVDRTRAAAGDSERMDDNPGDEKAAHSNATDSLEQDHQQGSSATTTYWRYLTSGWRERRRRSSD